MKVGDKVRISPTAYFDGREERFDGGLMEEWRGESGTVLRIDVFPWRIIRGKAVEVAQVQIDSIISDPAQVPSLDHWPVARVWVEDLLRLA